MSSPLKAIKEKCIDCNCGQVHEVKLCTASECPLYPYRFGHGSKRELSDEQRQALVERLRKPSVNENLPIN